jgi:cell division septum initiation protein DivIVA
MRETITVIVCILIFLVALQTGIMRTGLDYEAIKKSYEVCKETNKQLTKEIERLKHLVEMVSPAKEIVESSSEKKEPPAVITSSPVPQTKNAGTQATPEPIGKDALESEDRMDFDAGYEMPSDYAPE